jgi:hypothetical protein
LPRKSSRQEQGCLQIFNLISGEPISHLYLLHRDAAALVRDVDVGHAPALPVHVDRDDERRQHGPGRHRCRRRRPRHGCQPRSRVLLCGQHGEEGGRIHICLTHAIIYRTLNQ